MEDTDDDDADNGIMPVGQDPTAQIDESQMYQLALLAAQAPEKADFLMQNCPDSVYCSETLTFSVFGCVLFDLMTELDIFAAKRVFQHALMPLLRYGALYDETYTTSLLAVLANDGRYMSTQLWNRPDAMVEILIEATRHSHLPEQFMLECEDTEPEEAGHSNLVAYVRSLFPKRLQSQCRTVIHNHLPTGPNRVNALRDLNLPRVLIDFLNFEEFNLA